VHSSELRAACCVLRAAVSSELPCCYAHPPLSPEPSALCLCCLLPAGDWRAACWR
jgi:hypothetical protein